jgi:hypothetical protein
MAKEVQSAGLGRSDKSTGCPYTAASQAGDVAAAADAVSKHFGTGQLVLVAHDASGAPTAASSGPPTRTLLVRRHDKKRGQP